NQVVGTRPIVQRLAPRGDVDTGRATQTDHTVTSNFQLSVINAEKVEGKAYIDGRRLIIIHQWHVGRRHRRLGTEGAAGIYIVRQRSSIGGHHAVRTRAQRRRIKGRRSGIVYPVVGATGQCKGGVV